MLPALPAVPVALNVTGLPASVPDVAVREFGPAVVPSVQLPTVAIPLALVVRVAPVMLPPPDATANATATPATGLPLASFTITDGRTGTVVPAVTVWLFPAFTAICVALPAITATGVEPALVSPAAEKVRVRTPTSPVMVRFVNAACPDALVVTGLAPDSAEPPVAIAALTDVPLWVTEFPAASWRWTIGCRGNATPLLAVSDGWVTMTSCAAGPAARVMGPDVGPRGPVAVNVTVYVPVGPVSASAPNVARPFASVVAAAAVTEAPAGPVAIAAVTTIPAWRTGLPFASWICSAGCCASTTPLCAAAEGAVVRTSFPAAAAVMVKGALVPMTSPGVAAVSV